MSEKIKSIKTFLVNDDTDDKGTLIIYTEQDAQENITLEIQYNDDQERTQKTE